MPADSSFTDALAAEDGANPYKALRFLVIDDQKISRQTLRMSIQSMGGFHVDMAPSHGEALGRIRAHMPDVIICDYLLGGSRNGQYLLEKLRRSQALPDRVIFIMVTAEQIYAQVIAAVELVPDDYIIKPFAPEVLRLRLEKAIQRKLAFARFYAFKEANEYAPALAELDSMLARADCSNYRYEILRCRCDTLAAAELIDGAIAAYRSILAEHPFPWAKAGLARMLTRQQEYDEARIIIEEVISQVPAYFEAYDLKAHICTRQGDFRSAQEILAAAAAKTPHNWTRKRTLSIAASRNGDFSTAESLMAEVVQNDSLGDHSNAYIDLARSAMDGGHESMAYKLLRTIPAKQGEKLGLEGRISVECMTAIGEGAAGKARFERLRSQIISQPLFTVGTAIDVVRAALHFADRELADLTAERILAGLDARQAFLELLAIYREHGLESVFRELQKAIALRRVKEGKS